MPSMKTWRGNPFQPAEGKNSQAQTLFGSTGPWATGGAPPSLFLFSNNLVVGLGTVAADLVHCVYTGYSDTASVPVVLTDSNGNQMLASSIPAAFIAGAIGTPDIAYGWGLLDAVGNTLLLVENFDQPFAFANTGDRIELSWRYYLPPALPIPNPGS